MRIIVYGSLRSKQGNNHLMTSAQLIGEHELAGYQIYNLGHYQAAILDECMIYCEVYRINSSILAELDELKSNTKSYKSELIDTPYGSAWIYLYKHSVDG
ncbi:MAG: gamma-glutamylcyclotransferase [Serratia symbiotica]|nr:gamma-glutamylcyclotransferase [Serratia symbiotica]